MALSRIFLSNRFDLFEQQEFNTQLMNTQMLVNTSMHFDPLSPNDR
jgi:hypothetical protein